MSSRYVLSMMTISGLLGGGLVGGGLIGGCGEDASPVGGSSLPGEGEGDGDSPLPVGEGEGEGSSNEGEGALPPGADGEPCGGASKNECVDGLECGAEEPGMCTCPQWFEGRWFAEYSNVQAVDYEYDFTRGTGDQERWASHEVVFEQAGCSLRLSAQSRSMIGGRVGEEGNRVNPPPLGFWFKRRVRTDDGREGLVTFTGHLSDDHQLINGGCDGEYDDPSVSPATFFRVTCDFTLTRRE